jgi:serine/threonine protein kinase
MYSRIENIDPGSKYFVKAVKGCYANSEQIIRHPADPIQKCQMLQNYTHPIENVPQIIMPYAGIDLHNYLVAKRRIDFDEWLPLAINLVEAISVLRDHEICHFDIKTANIMIDNNNTARLTDFGLSTPFKYVYNRFENKMYSNGTYPSYVIWPPEIYWETFDSAIIEKTFTTARIGAFHKIHDIRNALGTLKNFIWHSSQENNEITFNDPKNIEKIDLFSLGITLIYLHKYIDFSKSSKIQKTAYITFVRKMADFDYTKRFSVNEALEAVNALATQ